MFINRHCMRNFVSSPVFTVSPVVTEHPQDQNVTSFEGTIVLRCTATGFPAPLITWFHNNTLESNTSNIMEENVNVYTTRSTLTIPMAERNDSGEYHCRAAIEGYNDIDSNPAIVLVQGKHSSTAFVFCCYCFVFTTYIYYFGNICRYS